MINQSESEERKYLQEVIEAIDRSIERAEADAGSFSTEMNENKAYLYENKADLDRYERLAMQQAIARGAMRGEASVLAREQLIRLRKSPYFGRIDFQETDASTSVPVYVGLNSFRDDISRTYLVYDWRAPISALYYDYDTGFAEYEAPQGIIAGEILVKRQYRIRNGQLLFMLENVSGIYDDILQEELSKASDERMKNIVATIQRDQHAIIRNETSRTLIIQGVAGSGKTSIALHRIAFLLYRYKESIRSREVLIISPNKVFASYISNVLPELGEEMIPEMGMEDLAHEVLSGKVKFQTFFEQVGHLLDKNDETARERIRFKGSFGFLMKLEQFIADVEKSYFQVQDIWIRRNFVPAWYIQERYDAWFRLPVLKRFAEITKEIEANIKFYYDYEIDAAERADIRKAVNSMFKTANIREIYKDFYTWLGQPDLYRPVSGTKLEYADVFPMIYLKIRLEGYKAYDQVKHLLVDEMQDYTPVQYAVLARLFSCKRTILGDFSQTVNPHSSSTVDDIQKVFPEADIVMLFKSYRSTYEITNFAQTIRRNPDLVAVERYGAAPEVLGFRKPDDEVDALKGLIADFRQSGYRSLGIICKTLKQAESLVEMLDNMPEPVSLLSPQSTSFMDGVVVTTAHMAKGLEFDQVIVPFASAANYHSEIDKSMLYIACTRAMHRLTISYSGKRSELLPV